MFVNSPRYTCAPNILPYKNIRDCRRIIHRMLVLVLYWSASLEFGKYSLSYIIITYTCWYNWQDKEKSANSRFANILSIITNPYESIGVDAINLVWVTFTSDVDTSDTMIRSSWYFCISDRSSFVNYIIANDLVQPKTSTFLHTLSFECTSKLCINFLNKISVYFHI